VDETSTDSQEAIRKRAETLPLSEDKLSEGKEKGPIELEVPQLTNKELMAQSKAKHHAKLMAGGGPLGCAMRFLHDNPNPIHWGNPLRP
jgi:hypothetical protein